MPFFQNRGSRQSGTTLSFRSERGRQHRLATAPRIVRSVRAENYSCGKSSARHTRPDEWQSRRVFGFTRHHR